MSKDNKPSQKMAKSYSGLYYARKSAEHLLLEIEVGNHHLIPAFVYAVCSGIEGVINDNFIDFFHKKAGSNYKELAKPFIHMNLREKLMIIVAVTSEYRYQIDKMFPSYKLLMKLFEIRNSFIHIQQHWRPAAIITRNENGVVLSYITVEGNSPYDAIEDRQVTLDDLRAYLKLFLQIIEDFYQLGGSVGIPGKFQRKNYKLRGWFKKLE